MSKNPLVSVIIIFLNAEPFLAEAVESVFGQTCDGWELLLVDDGSTDGSAGIAISFAERSPERVRYLTHERRRNRGMSASRNLGIGAARGDYVAFLDADDVWLPQKLERQLTILWSRPEAAMVYGPVQWWHDWTGRPEDAGRDFVNRLAFEPETLAKPPALVTALLQRETPTATACLVRRAAAEAVGGFEARFGGMYEDQAFFAKVCLQSPVFVAGECWYKWRKHPDSCCAESVRAGQLRDARREFLRWLEGHMSEQRVEDRETWNALRDAQWRNEHPSLERLRERADPGLRWAKQAVKAVAKQTLPASAQRRLRGWWRGDENIPPVGQVNLGDLRRVTPISRVWGYDRGQPVDRYYIERFLEAHAADVRGRVLEIADNEYTRRFGGDRVTQSDVLHAAPGNPAATVVADLSRGENLPSDAFDCVICTQTLLVIYDVRAAVRTLHRILKPGGVLLVTAPGGAHQITRYDMDRWGDYWRFTSLSVRRLFEEVFPPANVEIESYGNVLAAVSFLHGLASSELRPEELDYRDPDYEVSITVRAVKPGGVL